MGRVLLLLVQQTGSFLHVDSIVDPVPVPQQDVSDGRDCFPSNGWPVPEEKASNSGVQRKRGGQARGVYHEMRGDNQTPD